MRCSPICFLGVALLVLLMPIYAVAHEGDNGSETNNTTQHAEHNLTSQGTTALTQKEHAEGDGIFAPFDAFPNLHPLVVHFPIVLLLLALVSQLAGFIVLRSPLSMVTLVLLAGAFAGAFLAAQVFHPHTSGLDEGATEVLETHEQFANWTLWFSALAAVLKAASHFVFKRKLWAEILVLLAIVGASVSVTLTGHLGSQMVYIEGVGPQGDHIQDEQEH